VPGDRFHQQAANPLPPMEGVDNHITQDRAVDKIGEDARAAYQPIILPGRNDQVAPGHRALEIQEGAIPRPRGLPLEIPQLRQVEGAYVIGDGERGIGSEHGCGHRILPSE